MHHGGTETLRMKRKRKPSVPQCLRGEEKTMKKKKKKGSLPLVAPKHRMVLAADVWLKETKKEGKKK